MEIKILGENWTVKAQSAQENSKLEDANGLCEVYTREILINLDGKNERMSYSNIKEYYNKVLRHELFHAIFAEAGAYKYMEDEDLVNLLAMLYPKIEQIMKHARIENMDEWGE